MSDTMERLGQTCSVVYVDGEIGVPGDGGTPATALNNIPDPWNWAKETIYLCRKTRLANIVASPISGGECYFIAMPKNQDGLYEALPAACKAVWDGNELATMTFTVTPEGNVTFGPIEL